MVRFQHQQCSEQWYLRMARLGSACPAKHSTQVARCRGICLRLVVEKTSASALMSSLTILRYPCRTERSTCLSRSRHTSRVDPLIAKWCSIVFPSWSGVEKVALFFQLQRSRIYLLRDTHLNSVRQVPMPNMRWILFIGPVQTDVAKPGRLVTNRKAPQNYFDRGSISKVVASQQRGYSSAGVEKWTSAHCPRHWHQISVRISQNINKFSANFHILQ